MGRLTLNILLSFAQFEREIIAERTRDKMCAARRRGKWTGGIPMLGYDIDPKGGRLIVNISEAERVREIFTLYLQQRSLLKVVQELSTRSWTTKSWIRKNGSRRQGKPFTKTNLHNLLTNPIYLGKVKLHGDVYDGEHEAIVKEPLWNQVQQILKNNRRTAERLRANKHGVLLQGLVRCAHCKTTMFHSFTQKGNRRYRYYVCSSAQKKGYETCPSRSVPAAEMEKFVVERIREIGNDHALLKLILKKSRAESTTINDPPINMNDLKNAFSLFDPVWEMLFPKEQGRIMQLLVERVDYNATRETLAITFSPTRIMALSKEVETAQEKNNENEPTNQ
jgi:site-specific DNA recombinase